MTRRVRLPLLLGLSALLSSAAAAQRSPARAIEPPRWRTEFLISVAGPYARDAGSDTEVRGGIGAGLGLEALWSASERLTTSLFVRAAAGQVTVEGGGYRTHPGSTLQADIGLAVEHRTFRRVGLRGGVGLAWLHGPDDIVPFRYDNDAFHLMGELGATTRLSERFPLSASATFQTFRLGAARAADPVDEAGWVRRIMLGVRYGG